MKTLSDIEDENESTERRHTNRPEQSNIVDPQAEERALAEDDNELPFMPGALLEVRRVKTILDFSRGSCNLQRPLEQTWKITRGSDLP